MEKKSGNRREQQEEKTLIIYFEMSGRRKGRRDSCDFISPMTVLLQKGNKADTIFQFHLLPFL